MIGNLRNMANDMGQEVACHSYYQLHHIGRISLSYLLTIGVTYLSFKG